MKRHKDYIEKAYPNIKYNFILITPQKLEQSAKDEIRKKDIEIIAREDLKRILRKFNRIEEYLITGNG